MPDGSERNQTPGQVTRRQILKAVGTGLLASPVLLLAACTTKREQQDYIVKIKVIQSQSHFDPAVIEVLAGTTVVWQNQAPYMQTVTCDPSKAGQFSYVSLPKQAKPFDSGELYPGQTWSYTFTVPGKYLYFSRYKETPSIVGTVLVS